MSLPSRFVAILLALLSPSAFGADKTKEAQGKPPTMQEVLAASKPSDWRGTDPQQTVYIDLPAGRVVIELAPAFAPLHVDNIRKLVRAKYFDGLAIVRVHDGFVTQWGDPNAGEANARSIGDASKDIPPEFVRGSRGLPFTRLPDGDVYADEVGHSQGFPVARDSKRNEAWLAHCYGTVGVGRGNEAASGIGSELYVVIGHAPRQLDRNIASVGRVLQGMDLLASLPRGTGPLGFYDKPEQRTPIVRTVLAADLPEGERLPLQVLKTDTATFSALVESRRNRRDDWYHQPAGRIDLCNVPIPVRTAAAAGP